MELLLGLLWLAGISFAVNKAWQHVRSEYGKSRGAHAKQAVSEKKRPAPRRHAAAWWTREARYGFPVTRAGFQQGWQAHQTALEQTRARREEARTSHLEARASIAEEMHAHRQRQENAWNRVWYASEHEPQPQPAEDDELARKRATKDTPPPLPADTVQAPAPAPAKAPTPQEGNGHMATATETNYTTVTTAATSQAEQAEYAAADITRLRQQAEQIAEDMEAANVDSASIAEQMDHVAQLKAAEEALTAVTESGGQVVSGLQRRHGGIKEAVDDSPADPAEMGFYQE